MKIKDCPKHLNNCVESACPAYPCWAYEKYLDAKDRQKRENDSGWE